MKKTIRLFIYFFLTFGFMSVVHAASISVTSNVSIATSGGKITFYINIKDAGAWQLTGKGTGATSNCSLGDQGTGDSGNGKNINKTLSVTCNATDVGQINFDVSGNVSGVDNNGNVSSTIVSGRKVVAVQPPRPKDENNYLKSLNVKDYQITPEFNKNNEEYTLEVPSTVDKLTIEAIAESNYASVSGVGEVEVNEGMNSFDIIVTSETGIERIYKLKINVKDSNPISINIGTLNYTVIKNGKNLIKPELYEETTITIQGLDIPAFVSDITKFTLVGLKDEEGNIFLAIYDEKTNEYKIYNEQKSSLMVIHIMEPVEDIKGFQKVNLEIDGIEYHVFQRQNTSPFYLVYGMNVETGKKDYFMYHKESNTFQIYDEKLFLEFFESQKVRDYIILGLGIGCFALIIICIFALTHKSKSKPGKISKKQKEIDETIHLLMEEKMKKDQEVKSNSTNDSEKVDPEKLYVKDAVQKMNDVEKLIEQYEKTVSLSKKELEEKK